MKVLLTADLHLDAHKNSYDRLHDGLRVFDWINETAIAHGCECVNFIGDLFQHRQKIQVYVYQKVFEVFQKYIGKMKWNVLVGNHDMWFAEKWDVSSVMPLNALPNVNVIYSPQSMEIGGRHFDWLPYVKNPVKAIDGFFGQNRKGRILCAHIAVDGAKLGSAGQTSEVSVEFEGDMTKVAPEAFKGWQYVFMGHYHHAQFLDERMQYVGSPYQINFAEAGHTPHLVILDLDTMTLEYVENTFSPRHLIVNEDELAEADMANNFVQIRGDLTKFDEFEIQKSLAKDVRSIGFQAKKLKETPSEHSEIRERFNLAEGKTIERWIDAVGCLGLDRNELRSVGMEIVDECQGN